MSLKVNISKLVGLAKKIGDSNLQSKIEGVPKERAVAALIGQAIADNFNRGGPGWPENKFRKGRPLQKTGLLKKSVTIPSAQYNIYTVRKDVLTWGTKLSYASIHNKGGTITPKNSQALFIPITKKAESVGPQKNKEDQKKSGLKYGKDFLLLKSVEIPKREFLKLSAEWKKKLAEYMADRYLFHISNYLGLK